MLSVTNEHFMLVVVVLVVVVLVVVVLVVVVLVVVMLDVVMPSVGVPPGVNVINLFFFVANDKAKYARVFAPGKNFPV
jgi:hypothetical protein